MKRLIYLWLPAIVTTLMLFSRLEVPGDAQKIDTPIENLQVSMYFLVWQNNEKRTMNRHFMKI